MKHKQARITHATLTLLALSLLVIAFAPRARAGNGPFNGKIAFGTERDGNNEIYTMNADGTNPVNISNNPASDADLSWSPDGTKITFDSTRDSGDPEIYVMNVDGTGQTRLTSSIGTDGDPSWSPDGTKIAFHSYRNGNFEIYVMNADGTGQTRLTNSPGNDTHPAWSPDGTKIVFDSTRDGITPEIYVMNADGTNQTRLTNNTTIDQVPSFSPDGTKIVFQRLVNNLSQIFVMNANGTSPVQLPLDKNNLGPVFSPDGTKIIFSKITEADKEIYVINADGSNQVRLTNSPGDDVSPAWQPIPKLDTIGVFRPSTGQFLLRNFNTAGAPNLTITFGQQGDQPLAGDWDGDGIDDVGVFRNGQFLLRQATFGLVSGHPGIIVTIRTVNFGQAGDLAVVGDWNGDGIDTPGVFRPSTGQFLLTNSPNDNANPRAQITVSFGQSGDKPVAGDWNGDGRDSIGIYRESAGCTFQLSDNNSTVNITAANFCGAAPVSPLVGDWNGNKVDTIGIHSSSLAAFSLSNSNATLNGSAEIQILFGQNGDLPVAGDWNGANTPPDSGVNSPADGSSRAGQTQVFTTTCSDSDGWHNIWTIDFKLAKSLGQGNGVPLALWVQFDENRNVVRFFNPDLQTWTEGVPGANVTLSSRFADLHLAGTHIQGSGPTGSSVQITWEVVFKQDAVMNNYKQYLQITDDSGLSTGFDKVGSWSVAR